MLEKSVDYWKEIVVTLISHVNPIKCLLHNSTFAHRSHKLFFFCFSAQLVHFPYVIAFTSLLSILVRGFFTVFDICATSDKSFFLRFNITAGPHVRKGSMPLLFTPVTSILSCRMRTARSSGRLGGGDREGCTPPVHTPHPRYIDVKDFSNIH